MFTVIVFILILSFLVIIHEFGHFWVAKRSGVKVEEFGLGLPPRIFGIKKGETLYSLNALPFGGFVRLFGEEEEIVGTSISEAEKSHAFFSKSPLQRALVILAGPIMNFVLAVVILSTLFIKGVYLPATTIHVVEVAKQSPAAIVGLKSNDVIKEVRYKGKSYAVNSSNDVISLSKKFVGKEIVLVVNRNSSIRTFTITPRSNPPKGQGSMGIVISQYEYKKAVWYRAPLEGLSTALVMSKEFYGELFGAFSKLAHFQNPHMAVAGPVGIAKISGEAARSGVQTLALFVSLLSLNLALINILPFPALDGGQLFMIILEAITRRKISPILRARINTVGFAILIGLILLVTVRDIQGLF
ncbi:MAG: M50 family metallopeptidase [Candidatus Roizmanbacteria bacterium]|nr:M50 family metallopeptidase [Candidatus Roizmanbacteria bacterium]